MPNFQRPPAVAGAFYPNDSVQLEKSVMNMLSACSTSVSPPRAVVSPHAGYRFSGALTAKALAATGGCNAKTIVILSPSHRHAFDGVALPSFTHFAIPGANIPVDTDTTQDLVQAGLVHVEDAAHDHEHGIEVQLPFLNHIHAGTPIVPLVLGRVTEGAVAKIVDHIVARVPSALFVLSSDLSHFLPQPQADALDTETACKLEQGGVSFSAQEACGAKGLSGYLQSAHAAGSRIQRLGLANSAALTNDPTRTVGYGAWAMIAGQQDYLAEEYRNSLLKIARQALRSRLSKGTSPHIDISSFPPPLQTFAACFVTLERDARLRGCIGSLLPHRQLVEDVAVNAQKAALEDPRFRQLTLEELDHTRIKIAVLSPRRAMSFRDQADVEAQLVPGRDGLIIHDQGHTGTFLPMVWEKLSSPHAFLQALKRKAGLPDDHWSETLKIDLFHAETFAER